MEITFHSRGKLWQYYSKEHLDYDDQLNEEQWEEFVATYQECFTKEADEHAYELFSDFLEEIKGNKLT